MPIPIMAIIGAASAAAAAIAAAKKNKDAKNAADASTGLMSDQYDFYNNLTEKRENQRSAAITQWQNALGMQQEYKTPASVGKYVDLMYDLGGELSQLRDPSNKTGFNANNYKATSNSYKQFNPIKDVLGEDMKVNMSAETQNKVMEGLNSLEGYKMLPDPKRIIHGITG